jgi:hypothetical protein
VILPTFLAVLGCAGTVVLWGLIFWMRDRYGREILAAIQTIQNQKLTIDAMSEYGGTDREKIRAIKADVAERDETIDGLIAQLEGAKESYRVKCAELAARNMDLIEMRNKAREIVSTAFAHDPTTDSDQPEKPLCDN